MARSSLRSCSLSDPTKADLEMNPLPHPRQRMHVFCELFAVSTSPCSCAMDCCTLGSPAASTNRACCSSCAPAYSLAAFTSSLTSGTERHPRALSVVDLQETYVRKDRLLSAFRVQSFQRKWECFPSSAGWEHCRARLPSSLPVAGLPAACRDSQPVSDKL